MFSPAESNFIADTWSAVAEDLAPFDLDVSTEAPSPDQLIRSSPSDGVFGQVIAITTENFVCPGWCSGVAAIGVFDDYGAVTPGGWAFFEPFFHPAITASVISHEAGHLFGLSHDGTESYPYYGGHGSWSPLMGSVGWNRASQWSKGEYSGANNFEDDIDIIGATTGRINDTVGDVIAAANNLGDGNVSVDGLVDIDADVDVYRIVHPGGRLRVDVTPNAISANLDRASRCTPLPERRLPPVTRPVRSSHRSMPRWVPVRITSPCRARRISRRRRAGPATAALAGTACV